MRTISFWSAFFALALLGFTGFANAQVQIGISAGDGGLNSFYLSIGDYYHVPEAQVTVIKQRNIPDDQIPVVLFIAQRAHVEPQAVIVMRLDGSSWMDIALHFGLTPDVFYVPVQTASGPYGKAYGYYKHHKRKQWKAIRLEDDDIVNLVNLRFLSERYGYSPDTVVKMRSGGRNFVQINDDFRGKWQKKHGVSNKDEGKGRDEDQAPGHSHGHGHDDDQGIGHGHGHGHGHDDDQDHNGKNDRGGDD